MSIKQISVFLENRPGKLSDMTALLAENQINIRALSLAETKDFGIARMIVDDLDKATDILEKENFIAKFSPVLAFSVPDEPGGLNKLLGKFNEAGVNIEYMYAVMGSKATEHAYMIFRVRHTEASEEALLKAGLKSMTQEEISEIL